MATNNALNNNLASGTGLPLTTGVTGTLPVANGGTGVITSTGTGSVVLSTSPTLTGIISDKITWSDTTKGIVGTTTNNNASSGYVGEFISSVILVGSSVTLTANVVANITSISLTAGDWDVWGNVNINTTAQTQTYSFAWISETSATQPADAYIQGLQISQAITINNYRAITPLRFSLNATTTVYLSVVGDGGGTLSGWGAIYARRVR